MCRLYFYCGDTNNEKMLPQTMELNNEHCSGIRMVGCNYSFSCCFGLCLLNLYSLEGTSTSFDVDAALFRIISRKHCFSGIWMPYYNQAFFG